MTHTSLSKLWSVKLTDRYLRSVSFLTWSDQGQIRSGQDQRSCENRRYFEEQNSLH